jgi:hypothetical protein
MDLATGTAGVLLALSAALDDRPACLPFLGSAEAPYPRETSGGSHAHRNSVRLTRHEFREEV